jgi:hypothetical protein
MFDHLLEDLDSDKTKAIVRHMIKSYDPEYVVQNSYLSNFIKVRSKWLYSRTKSAPQFSWKILDDFSTTEEVKEFLKSESETKIFYGFVNSNDAFKFISKIGLNIISAPYHRIDNRPKILRYLNVSVTDYQRQYTVKLKKTGEMDTGGYNSIWIMYVSFILRLLANQIVQKNIKNNGSRCRRSTERE